MFVNLTFLRNCSCVECIFIVVITCARWWCHTRFVRAPPNVQTHSISLELTSERQWLHNHLFIRFLLVIYRILVHTFFLFWHACHGVLSLDFGLPLFHSVSSLFFCRARCVRRPNHTMQAPEKNKTEIHSHTSDLHKLHVLTKIWIQLK